MLRYVDVVAAHRRASARCIKASHPTWSPVGGQVRADDHGGRPRDLGRPVRPGRRVRPAQPRRPTPAWSSTPSATDWRRYMVGLGVQFAPPNDTLTALAGSDLNQASIAIGSMAGQRTLARTVTNVSNAAETYAVSPSVPGIAVTGDAGSFTPRPRCVQDPLADVHPDDAALGSWAKGSLTLTGGTHKVRIPVAIRPVAIAAPTEITGTIAQGSTSYSVTPGFSGPLTSRGDRPGRRHPECWGGGHRCLRRRRDQRRDEVVRAGGARPGRAWPASTWTPPATSTTWTCTCTAGAAVARWRQST